MNNPITPNKNSNTPHKFDLAIGLFTIANPVIFFEKKNRLNKIDAKDNKIPAVTLCSSDFLPFSFK